MDKEDTHTHTPPPSFPGGAAAAAAAKSLQSCPTLCDPIDGSPPGFPVPGILHWSGLPFPSPTQESEKWKGSRSVVSDSSRPHGLQPTRLLRPWDFPGKSAVVGCHCLLRQVALVVKTKQNKTKQKPACQRSRCKRLRFNPWVWKIPCRRKWQPTPVF